MDSIYFEFRPLTHDAYLKDFFDDKDGGKIQSLVDWSVNEVSDPMRYFLPKFIELLANGGLAEILQQNLSLEDIVGEKESISMIESVMQKFFSALAGAKEIVITDPYFFASHAEGDAYPKLVSNSLKPVLAGLKKLVFITSPKKIDVELKSAVTSELTKLNETLEIIHLTSNSIHDRFWLDPHRPAGFITGTSLGGLGRKYALVSYLTEEDAATIVDNLKKLKLI